VTICADIGDLDTFLMTDNMRDVLLRIRLAHAACKSRADGHDERVLNELAEAEACIVRALNLAVARND
jgi:hypothetical protein